MDRTCAARGSSPLLMVSHSLVADALLICHQRCPRTPHYVTFLGFLYSLQVSLFAIRLWYGSIDFQKLEMGAKPIA